VAGVYAERGEGVSVHDKSKKPRVPLILSALSEKTADGSASATDFVARESFGRFRKLAGRLNYRGRGRRPDYWDFIWLVYSIFFFIDPIEHHSQHFWIEFAVFYGLFLALYSCIVLARYRWQSYLSLIGIAVLGAAYFPLNNGAAGTFVYAAAFLPFITESLVVCLSGFVLLLAGLITEAILLGANPWAWGFCALFTFIVGGTNLFMAQKVRANCKLQMAHEEIEQLAKVAERERIARDLHDVLGHTLSVVVLKSELAGRLIAGDPQRAKAEIADVEQIARKALSEVREAISGYRSEGLAAEIKRAHSALDAAGVTLICEAQPPQLSPTEETVMSLVLREAVTNVVRHAQASQCVMRFVTQNGKTSLVVEDDGRGGVREEGNGLRGMRERVESVGGRFEVEGTRGTRLTIELPD
jgi:two-component system, NarL family, sensor histidine kinase DesK